MCVCVCVCGAFSFLVRIFAAVRCFKMAPNFLGPRGLVNHGDGQFIRQRSVVSLPSLVSVFHAYLPSGQIGSFCGAFAPSFVFCSVRRLQRPFSMANCAAERCMISCRHRCPHAVGICSFDERSLGFEFPDLSGSRAGGGNKDEVSSFSLFAVFVARVFAMVVVYVGGEVGGHSFKFCSRSFQRRVRRFELVPGIISNILLFSPFFCFVSLVCAVPRDKEEDRPKPKSPFAVFSGARAGTRQEFRLTSWARHPPHLHHLHLVFHHAFGRSKEARWHPNHRVGCTRCRQFRLSSSDIVSRLVNCFDIFRSQDNNLSQWETFSKFLAAS